MRELILSGELAPGQRFAEIPIAKRLGVSRTPVRHALAVLAKEGLLVEAGARGYVVRAFTLKDIVDAIELRGTLEGMAARLVAEAGLAATLERRLEECLAEGDGIIGRRHHGDGDVWWSQMNDRFHKLIVDACGNQALVNALSLNDQMPFASAGALLGGDTEDPRLLKRHREILARAQIEHRSILEALHRREGARAEALLREHALRAKQNVLLFRAAIPAIAGSSRSETPVERK
ncbi:MAG: GntR family transcriptional regulator [Proteobacteria bacterium]|nr:GntR family transcriptional regulator [Pseudomonadota bacterium]